MFSEYKQQKERDILTDFDNQIWNSAYLCSYSVLELKIETTSHRWTLLILLFSYLHVRAWCMQRGIFMWPTRALSNATETGIKAFYYYVLYAVAAAV